jgi:quinohemoprotein ethanol dehydrogenase
MSNLTSLALGALSAIVASLSHEATAAPAGDVSQSRVIAEAAKGESWLVNGGSFNATHYSPLTQITDRNVDHLGLAWWLDIDSPMGMASEPIVVDGTIFVSGSLDRVYAVDAATGKLLWRFAPNIRLSVMRNSWAARTNRGVAVWEGKVFVGTGDCRVIALDAASGRQLWSSPVCVDTTQTGITGAPRVGGGKVYIGYNGSDTGVRGSVVALDANTGKLAWRFWTVPGDPAKGFENKTLEMAAKTWAGTEWWKAGGGDVWDAITYDAPTGQVIFGTAGASYGERGNSEGLFSGSIVAVNADTGEYVWHYQTSTNANGLPPGSVGAQSPENFHIIATDLSLRGVRRHVVMTVPRFGAFFILDARTGKRLSVKSLADRPQAQHSPAAANGLPRSQTGHNWWPMSYNPTTGLVYIPAYDDVPQYADYLGDALGRLIAWDPVNQTSRWSYLQRLSHNSGVLSTAGNLVFQGEGTGEFEAFAADHGTRLWSIDTGSAIQAVPVTFTAQGSQYILVPVGFGSGSRLFAPNRTIATPESKRGPSRLLAFKLGAQTPFPFPKIVVPRVPKPPEQTATPATIQQGAHVAQKFRCMNCHGGHGDGSGAWLLDGAIPDLRYMPQDIHDKFLAIVLAGLRRAYGMPGFADGSDNFPIERGAMTTDEAVALHAYLIDLQWKAYKDDEQQQRAANRTAP